MSAPRLLETMRAESGRIALLDRHLARLAASAETLGYPVDEDAIRQHLAEAVGEGVEGVRLTLGATGTFSVDTWPLADEPFRTAWIDPVPLSEAGTWRCTLKTTARDHYRQRAERARQRGADEAILTNARGEVVEGTRTSVWIERDGRLWTPPLSAGGLAGVMRAHILSTRAEAGERVLSAIDVQTADAVFLSNALRGWMAVGLVSGS